MGIQPPHTVVPHKNISISTFIKTEKMANNIGQERTSNRTRKIKLILTVCLFSTPEELKGEKGGRWSRKTLRNAKRTNHTTSPI